MSKINIHIKIILIALLMLSGVIYSQQDPQYTQYMYNTMSVNPAYVGSREHTTIVALGRTQWVGVEGAPKTITLSYDTSLGYTGLGLGVNIVGDKIGPTNETYLDANLSYTIRTSDEGNLALGLKLGARLLNINLDNGQFQQQGDLSLRNTNRILPTIGAGVYYYKPSWYLGIAVPNFLRTDHYDSKNILVAEERFHLFLIGGYVFNLSETLKFKPTALLKAVNGAPLSLDVSANLLFNNKIRVGVAWRWGDSVSALLGFQASESLHIGFAYDLTTSDYRAYNLGTYELMLRYEIFKEQIMKSPRFF